MDGNRELRMIRIRFKPNLGGTFLILLLGITRLNSRIWVESGHIGMFEELGRACQTTR